MRQFHKRLSNGTRGCRGFSEPLPSVWKIRGAMYDMRTTAGFGTRGRPGNGVVSALSEGMRINFGENFQTMAAENHGMRVWSATFSSCERTELMHRRLPLRLRLFLFAVVHENVPRPDVRSVLF